MSSDKEILAQKFNSYVSFLSKMLYEKNRSSQFETIKTAVSSAIRNVPFSLIDNSEDFWNHRNYITDIRDGDEYNWSLVDKIPIPRNADTSVVTMIKDIFNNSTQEERIEVYEILIEMLVIVAKYRKL